MSEILSAPLPQVAQLELLFAGPLVKGTQVNTFGDLLLLNPLYNYLHKLVWVKADKSFYFLDNGDGTNTINWVKQSSRVVIKRYDSETTYTLGETVYLSGKIYSAKQAVPIHYDPINYEDYWLCIAGETETFRYLFQNTASVIIYTEIRNPKFEVILGEFVYDGNGIIVLDPVTGLSSLINKRIVEAFVTQREDLPNNNGVAYEISFYEDDDVSVQVSGCINIK